MFRKTIVACLLPVATAGVAFAGAPVCDRDVLPDRSFECAYRVVPYASFSLQHGELDVRWSGGVHATQLTIAENWQRVAPYRPGKSRLALSESATRYDVVGRFRDRTTGEEYLGVTPVACRGADGAWVVPAPPGGCDAGRTSSDCSVQVRVRCLEPDGTPTAQTQTVTCDGDGGTCSDCSTAGEACCTSSTTTTTTDRDGVVQTTVVAQKKTARCEP